LSDEIEESAVKRMNVVAQNGNDGIHYKDLANMEVDYELVKE
jgi:hypothetical protein